MRFENNINQSKVALEWLSCQEHLLQKQAYMDMAKEDHKAYDLMELAYNDSIHPLYQTHIQHAAMWETSRSQNHAILWTVMTHLATLFTICY